jgi:hypothetical protein
MPKIYIVFDYDFILYAGLSSECATAAANGGSGIQIWQLGKMVGEMTLTGDGWVEKIY